MSCSGRSPPNVPPTSPGLLTAVAGVAAVLVAITATPAARADIPPSCDQEASLITCAASDVGKPCQGGGQCYAVDCSSTTAVSPNPLYKCDACPSVIPTSGSACSTTTVGTPCGNGGTCTVLSAWCASAGGKYVCAIAATAQPTGPPKGETGAGGGSNAASGGSTSAAGGGCAVVADAGTAAVVAGGLIAIGLGLLSVSRGRRRR